ncbi:MAG: hypothetical protein ACK53L_30225, partial [Pirellulaceae bacterium]
MAVADWFANEAARMYQAGELGVDERLAAEVVELVRPAPFGELALPLPREYDQAPDAVLVVKEGYSVSASAEGDTAVATHTEAKASLGSHGYLASNPKMNAMCVLWGPRIRPGVE